MTVVITYLAKDNAKSRYRARRAAKREQMDADARLARKIATASAGCSLNVARATHLPGMREEKEYPLLQSTLNAKYQKVTNEAGRQIHATQRIRGKSIPLI